MNWTLGFYGTLRVKHFLVVETLASSFFCSQGESTSTPAAKSLFKKEVEQICPTSFHPSSFRLHPYVLKITSKYFFNKSLTMPRRGKVAAMP